jgi:prophage regulatory protein
MPEKALSIPDVGFMRLRDILKIFPVGKSTWFANVRSGVYPKPVKLGPNTSAWRVDDIRKLVARFGGLHDQEAWEVYKKL